MRFLAPLVSFFIPLMLICNMVRFLSLLCVYAGEVCTLCMDNGVVCGACLCVCLYGDWFGVVFGNCVCVVLSIQWLSWCRCAVMWLCLYW